MFCFKNCKKIDLKVKEGVYISAKECCSCNAPVTEWKTGNKIWLGKLPNKDIGIVCGVYCWKSKQMVELDFRKYCEMKIKM